MGAHSTLSITRGKAIAFLVEQIMLSDDSALARILDTFICDRLYSSKIVESCEINDDDIL